MLTSPNRRRERTTLWYTTRHIHLCYTTLHTTRHIHLCYTTHYTTHTPMLHYTYIPYIPERSPHFMPQIPNSKLGVRRSFQVQTATWHKPFHPGLCVPLSSVHLSRLQLTQQSLKRVGHEEKLCLKVEQRHPPCLSKVPLS